MTPKLEPKQNRVRWTIGISTYPMDAVYGACYVFLDRAYVYLDKPEAKQVEVVLKGKDSLGDEELEALAGEFSNELLHQVLRNRIAKKTATVRDMIVGRALFSAEENLEEFDDDFDDLDDLDDDADYLDDPLGIAVPWEEKYGDEAADGKDEVADDKAAADDDKEPAPAGKADGEDDSK